jgi:hypothetical protein
MPQMLLFSFIILLLYLAEFPFLSFQSTENKNSLFTAQIIEHGLRDDLADLYEILTSLSKLPDGTNSEIFSLTTHALHKRSQIFGDLLRSNKELGNIPSIKLLTYLFGSFFYT